MYKRNKNDFNRIDPLDKIQEGIIIVSVLCQIPSRDTNSPGTSGKIALNALMRSIFTKCFELNLAGLWTAFN